MFRVKGKEREDRIWHKKTIRCVADIDLGAGIILAATYFEWCVRRSILALGCSSVRDLSCQVSGLGLNKELSFDLLNEPAPVEPYGVTPSNYAVVARDRTEAPVSVKLSYSTDGETFTNPEERVIEWGEEEKPDVSREAEIPFSAKARYVRLAFQANPANKRKVMSLDDVWIMGLGE